MEELSSERILDQLREGMLLLNRDFRIVFCNPAFCKLTGFDRADCQGMLLADLAASARDRLVLSSPDSSGISSVRLKTASGRKIRTELSFSPLLDLENGHSGYAVTVRDVSEIVARDEQLRLSLEKYRDIAFAGADWIWEIDSSGTYVYVSSSVEEHLGYSPGDLFGRTPFELMDPAEGARAAEAFTALALHGRSLIRYRSSVNTSAGRKKVIETSGVPVYDSGGNLKGYRGLDRDITEEVRISGELKRSLEQTKKILEKLPVGVLIVDRNKRIRDINRTACILTGVSREDVIGKICHRLMCPTMKNRCPIIDLGQTVDNAERFVLSKEGRMIPVVKSVIPVTLGGEDLLLEVFADVTEIRSLRSSLKEQNKKLENALRAIERREILARKRSEKTVTRHREFLVSMLDSLSVLDTALNPAGDLDGEKLSLIREENCRMTEALNRLRELYTTATGSFNAEQELFHVRTMMNTVRRRLLTHRNTGITSMEIVIGSEVPALLEGSAVGIMDTIVRLLDWAASPSEPASVFVGISTLGSSPDDPLPVRFSIACTPVHQWSESTQAFSEGDTGEKILPELSVNAELMGGEIHLKQSEGGFLVWLDLPLKPWTGVPGRNSVADRRVFAVLRESRMRNTISQVLQGVGFLLTETLEPEEVQGVLGTLTEGEKVVFIIDMDRRSSALKLLATLKAASRISTGSISVLGLISRLERGSRNELSNLGCSAILHKPLNGERLRECITLISQFPDQLVTDLSLPPDLAIGHS